MGKLDAAARKRIPKTQFAVPSKAPASGSYPIEDRSHARNALARSSGKPVEAQVRAAVKRKYPDMVSVKEHSRKKPTKREGNKGEQFRSWLRGEPGE